MKEMNLKKYFTAIKKNDVDTIRIESEKIDAAIAAAEGRAKVRKLTPKDIYNAISEVEDRLNIPKKYLEGIKVVVDVNADTFPNAYKYIPESTYFEAVFRSGSWKLTDVYRYKTAGKTCGYNVSLTDDAKAAIISRLERF